MLTDVRFDALNLDPGVYPTSWYNVDLGGDFGGTFTVKNGSHFDPALDYFPNQADATLWSGSESTVGLVFRPGSSIKIRYTNPSDVKGDIYVAHVSWNLTGYLTDV